MIYSSLNLESKKGDHTKACRERFRKILEDAGEIPSSSKIQFDPLPQGSGGASSSSTSSKPEEVGDQFSDLDAIIEHDLRVLGVDTENSDEVNPLDVPDTKPSASSMLAAALSFGRALTYRRAARCPRWRTT